VRAQHVILLLSIALLASFAGAFAYRYVYLQPLVQSSEGAAPGQAQKNSPDSVVGSPRPDFMLGSSTGEQVSASFFDGSVTLVNFWATWCKPCREEMPMLRDLHKAYAPAGLKVVGVAIDDVQQARGFAAELGVDYTILVGSIDVMSMAQSYGNQTGVLPYSVLIGRDGIVRWTHLGELKEKELVQHIEELLAAGS